MPLLELQNVEKDWGLEPIFSGLSLKIEEGEKIGLVGANGCGKTSLLRILAGLDEDFKGTIKRQAGLKVALVPQRYEPPMGKSCVEIILEPASLLKARIEELSERLASQGDSAVAALEEYGELFSAYEALGGDLAEERARRLLERSGLGAVADAQASSLSGGEKNVLALAAALASDPGLVLLDEPGNHLDFAGLAWLEDFVRGERRAVLMVSHNRSLLDRTVGTIVELEGGRAAEYSGGYSAYRIEKLSRRAGQGRDWQADRKKIERLEALVARFAQIAAARADPAWGKRLRARRSQLEREKEAAASRPEEGRSMSVSFGAASSKADYALVVRGYSKAFGDRVLFNDAGFDLLAGERAAIVGPNGSGKTSFLRDLVSRAESGPDARWESGEAIRVGPSMILGYCAQEQEVFKGERTVGEEFYALGAKEEEAFRLLKRYLFDRSILGARISTLSGGERNRLQIARAVFLGANFLVLDEPTNHLDIESAEALEEALSDFGGTILAVSHDRWFLEKTADRLILVEGGRLLPYEGSFAEYWRDRGSSLRPRKGTETSGLEGRLRSVSASRSKGPGEGKGEERRVDLERRITALEKEKEDLERSSAAAGKSRDFSAAGKAAERARSVSRTLDKLYAEWETAGLD
jgi:ATP-binding cassette subfamily F protein 3